MPRKKNTATATAVEPEAKAKKCGGRKWSHRWIWLEQELFRKLVKEDAAFRTWASAIGIEVMSEGRLIRHHVPAHLVPEEYKLANDEVINGKGQV